MRVSKPAGAKTPDPAPLPMMPHAVPKTTAAPKPPEDAPPKKSLYRKTADAVNSAFDAIPGFGDFTS